MENKEDIKEEEIVYGLIGLLLLPFMIMSSLWVTYIMWDVSTLYGLQYLTQYGYEVFFGTIMIANIYLARFIPYKKRPIKESVSQVILGQIAWFMFWAIAYFFHWLLRF